MNIREYLTHAIALARQALECGNYPFGAVLTNEKGEIVATGFNENFSKSDISAHAEIQCMRKMDINVLLDPKRKFTLFSSAEPCCACSFFIARTNITHVYFALTDPQKTGLADLKQNSDFANFFGTMTVYEEPFADLREQSAALLRQYYTKLGKPEKAKLY